GQVSGVAVDGRGDVVVFHRADHPWIGPAPTGVITSPPLLRLDAETGALRASFGGGLFTIPHGLRAGADDTLWVTDVGVHKVYKLSAAGEVLATFGTGSPGADDRSFNQPTDVYEAPDGSIFVADGYGNSRVVRLTAAGVFVKAWG